MSETKSEGRRTIAAIRACAYWLSECVRLGWSRDHLDALEALWWEHHDERGNLKATTADWGWVCNECGAHEYTNSVSEQGLHYLSCGSCGCDEFHKEPDRARSRAQS